MGRTNRTRASSGLDPLARDACDAPVVCIASTNSIDIAALSSDRSLGWSTQAVYCAGILHVWICQVGILPVSIGVLPCWHVVASTEAVWLQSIRWFLYLHYYNDSSCSLG
ncbi:hypothetical protein Y032_0002g1116 [Ancylostoma ceylanicum]|uniref:Uncharacterized protein n=1 Tax=Ancylostoma ceylanicum TaxID=53326 RepID=A0A016VZK0_9BILA|nr:hypothetical protein Y032_0002g1116 [Ancylostoma ceylanicum]